MNFKNKKFTEFDFWINEKVRTFLCSESVFSNFGKIENPCKLLLNKDLRGAA